MVRDYYTFMRIKYFLLIYFESILFRLNFNIIHLHAVDAVIYDNRDSEQFSKLINWKLQVLGVS